MKFLLVIPLIFLLNLADSESNHQYKQQSVTNDTLTVMSFNIRFDNPDDGINAWPNRKDQVADMTGNRYPSDIIGLQEALKHQIDELQTRLPGYSWVGVGRDDGKERGEYSPIFYRISRLELLETDTFWLSETPEIPGSKSWDAAITRVVTWAKFKDLNSGQEFIILNTHFDHIGEQARLESAKIIRERILQMEKLPLILTGDFNVPESSGVYSVLADTPGIQDARYASKTGHQGPTASFSDWEVLREPETRIDYIFVNDKVRVLSHQIADDQYDGRYPSDHLPVIAEVLIQQDE
jgi:endonuclease/exonuclease/phosphatase family metal-dependent hydrolase